MMGTDNVTLQRLKPLVRKLVRRGLQGRYRQHADDVTQEALLVLWRRVIPNYDPADGPIERLARVAIKRTIIEQLRVLRNRSAGLPILPNDVRDHRPGIDAHAMAFAAAIVAEPERFLPKYLARILTALQSYSSPALAACALDMSRPTFYRLTHRLRDRIKTIFESERSRLGELPRKAA